jgi:hypothetical protein
MSKRNSLTLACRRPPATPAFDRFVSNLINSSCHASSNLNTFVDIDCLDLFVNAMEDINMSLTEAATDKVLLPSRKFGYGNWLQPIINANDRSESATCNARDASSSPIPAVQRRGRGRPPVARPRNDSAIEVY